MVSKNLQLCLRELKLLVSIKDKKARAIVLKKLSKKSCIYDAMREIAINILNKNIPLNKRQLKKLGPHAKTIKRLACGVKEKKKRPKLVNQSGGILPFIIPLLTTIAGAAASKLIDKI
jgi:hypothetical protein